MCLKAGFPIAADIRLGYNCPNRLLRPRFECSQSMYVIFGVIDREGGTIERH